MFYQQKFGSYSVATRRKYPTNGRLSAIVVASMLFVYALPRTIPISLASSVPDRVSRLDPASPTQQNNDFNPPVLQAAQSADTGSEREKQVQKLLNDFVSSHPDANFGIAIQDLGSQELLASFQDSATFKSASLYKTLAAYRVLQRIDSGELGLDERSGELDLMTCIKQAIIVSDNPCGIWLQTLAQPSHTDKMLPKWNMPNTTLSGYFPQTSARDQLELLRRINNGTELSEQSRALLMGHLANQTILDRLPQYPEGTRIYHKTGDLDGTVNSLTLVKTARASYIVSFLSDSWDLNLLTKYTAIERLHGDIHRAINELP